MDSGGFIYLAGGTKSEDFPTIANSYQFFPSGGLDGLLAKLDPTQSGPAALVYSTYAGGTGNDRANAITLSAAGNVSIAGFTDFTVQNAFQPTYGGGTNDAFVLQFDTTQAGAASVVYSSYLGGSGTDRGFGIAMDPAVNFYVTGDTASPDFPVTANAFQNAFAGGASDAFLTKIGPNANDKPR